MFELKCLLAVMILAHAVYADCPYGFSGSDCKDECGLHYKKANIADKIVGGQVAEAYSWPATVYLMMSDGSACGGTLINRKTILTAAHCVDAGADPNSFTVYLGVQDASSIIAQSGGTNSDQK
jgi:hypothetical protein